MYNDQCLKLLNFILFYCAKSISLQDRLRKMAEEQRNLIQEQNQRQAQVLRFEDELARKRMQVQAELTAIYSFLLKK